MRLVSIAIALIVPLLGVASCFEGPSNTAADAGDAMGPECTPGDTRNCTCSGVLGTETCNDAGDAWGECECGMTTGATSPIPTSGPMVTTTPPGNDTGDGTTGTPPPTSTTGDPPATGDSMGATSDPSTTGDSMGTTSGGTTSGTTTGM